MAESYSKSHSASAGAGGAPPSTGNNSNSNTTAVGAAATASGSNPEFVKTTPQQTPEHEDDDDDEENQVVESDPSGRYSRTAKLLGKGAYKDVFRGFDEDEGVEVAWNQLRVDHLAKREAQRILSEIQILKALRNDNIITMYHAWGAKGADGRERVFFITELMTAGTLKSYLKKTAKGQPTRLPVLKKWCRQILQGLNYLHSRNPPIIHRDLKCENIFMNSNGQAKIGDLGLAIPKSRDHASSVLGTPEFMAPELYDENYDEKVDIYAFGMVVLEMVTKEYPYSECTNQYQIYKKVTSGVRPLSLSKISDEQTIQFIELCIQFNPHQRPSAFELMSHPFLKVPDGATSMSGSFSGTPITGASSSSSLESGKAGSASNLEVEAVGSGSGGLKDSILESSEHRYIQSPHQSMSRPSDSSKTPTATTAIPTATPTLKDITPILDISIARSASITSAGSVDSRQHVSSSPVSVIPLPQATLVTPPSSNPPSISGDSSAPNLLSTASSSTASLQIPSTTTPTPSSTLAAVTSTTGATVTIELFDRHSENTVTLRMIYTTPPPPNSPAGMKPQSHEIKFPFNLPEDTATDVVSEMVDQNLIAAKDEVLARRKLEEKVKNILLGRVEESSRRASEVPPNGGRSTSTSVSAAAGQGSSTSSLLAVGSASSLSAATTAAAAAANTLGDTSLRDRNSDEQKYATMPRMSSSDNFGRSSDAISSVGPAHSTMPRANSILSDLQFVVPRTLSNSSLSSSTSSSGGSGGAGNGRLSPQPTSASAGGQRAIAFQPPPHITPNASPQPVKKAMPQSQLQQVSSIGDVRTGGVLAKPSVAASSGASLSGQKATFSLLSETPPLLQPLNADSFVPSSSVSEGYKRGQSGSSISSTSEYAHSVDGGHLRRPSQMSEGGGYGGQWSTSSIHSDTGVGLRPVVPSSGSMERVNSAASMTGVSSNSQQQQQQQQHHGIISPTPISHSVVLPNATSLPVFGPMNNPANPPQLSTTPPSTSNSQSAAVQQRLLELQERSLKDLGTGVNNTHQYPSSAPHINHHAVHHLQHHHPQFHPHHAPSYPPGVMNPNRPVNVQTGAGVSNWTAGGSVSSGSSSTASSTSGTPPTLSGGQRPINIGSVGVVSRPPPSSSSSSTTISQSSSPNFNTLSLMNSGGVKSVSTATPAIVGLGVNPGVGVVRPGGVAAFPLQSFQQQQNQQQGSNRQNSH
ncbi:UNVERIFIED_CONTAM: Serine/threonine-protein kinase wnk4 [Siphonaria sp. JEL0065]|nr:Serine/threonine-protein kinase wnk4 [Siphonaria sp. JEL0065]